MPYITMPMETKFHQITWDELLSGYVEPERFEPVQNAPSSTRTIFVQEPNAKLLAKYDLPKLIAILRDFNTKYAELFEIPRESMYTHYDIPKRGIDPKTGRQKTRPIDDPSPELRKALIELREIFFGPFGALYHTSAFAYINRRSVINAIQRHQGNQSRWFLSLDFSNFFGSTTLDFLFSSLSQIFPFSEVVRYPSGADALRKALSLCMLNGGLPQGSPISPMLTNLMMIPIDHKIKNGLINFTDCNHYVYTRYADDILVSCKYKTDYHNVVKFVKGILEEFNAPFALNPDKTRYQNNNGKNYHLGVILNQQNQITVGYKQKREFRYSLVEYITFKQTGVPVDLHYVQQLMGQLNWYSNVEPNYWDAMLKKFKDKYHVDVKELMLEDLRA